MLPPSTTSAGTARRFAADALRAWGCEELEDTVLLLVSELVTNAVLYARKACELALRLDAATLRVEVLDRSPRLPSQKHYDDDAATGRGLLLVEALAEAWGTDVAEDGSGKSVWFEVDASVCAPVETATG